MINQTYVRLGSRRSCIRELFEYSKKRKAEIGEDNVFDFSIGNPSVPAPPEVTSALEDILRESDPVSLHGYTSAQGDYGVRKTIADYTNSRFKTNLDADCIYMTCGAAASLTICLNAIAEDGDEIITFAPYFPEYKVFCEHARAKLVVVPPTKNFDIDTKLLEGALTAHTKGVIINSPNNPSGVVYSENTIKQLAKTLEKHSEKIGSPVYLIADEPYRELVFSDGTKVPYAMNYYARTLVCYSYSKSLSLPGERIGYIAVNNLMPEWREMYAAVCGAGRALGFVCAPALFQQLVKRVYDKTADISVYKTNRDRLYEALTGYGFMVVKPEGAFYAFLKSPEPDANAFAERAKKYEILFVPADDFGCEGYVRIAYCVAPETIERALPSFKALAESYGLTK